MAIASAFYTALSGLSVNSANLSVIGNNLANLNTIGFKGTSSTFEDLFSTTLGASAFQGNGNPMQVGLGAQVAAVMQNFGQSTFQSTSNVTDMAIQGNGFFYLRLANGGFGHSRAGNFTIDQFGYVLDPAGNKLQGYNRNSDAVIDETMGSEDIRLPIGETITARATAKIQVTTNLNATDQPPNDRYTTSVQVYDSLGERHTILITYEKNKTFAPGPPPVTTIEDNQWRFWVWAPDALSPEDSAHPGTALKNGPPTDAINETNGTDYWALAEGVVHFDASGKMVGMDDNSMDMATLGGLTFLPPYSVSPFLDAFADTDYLAYDSNRNDFLGGSNAGDFNPMIPVKWKNGSSSNAFSWSVNTGGLASGGGKPNFLITQTASASGTTNSQQNGYGAGTIQGLTVDQQGYIIGTFTNGQTYPLARVALSIFTNNHGLQKIGENIWKETLASGPANIGTANDVGRGSVLGAHLEMSNVDVADEFTRLIITQRGYQANSRIVTTSDEMMQETLNLKR
jgi:flagellar hook protein FlgE